MTRHWVILYSFVARYFFCYHDTTMPNNEVTTGEIMSFLQEHMVTKEELKQELSHEVSGLRTELKDEISGLRMEFKQDISILGHEMHTDFATKVEMKEMLTEFKDEILNAVDVIALEHQTFNQELAAIHLQNGRRDERLNTVERKLGLTPA